MLENSIAVLTCFYPPKIKYDLFYCPKNQLENHPKWLIYEILCISISPQSFFPFVFCACLILATKASYSNCPKVSISVASNLTRRGCRSGNFLRARLSKKTVPYFLDAVNKPRQLDAGGRKPYKPRTGNNISVILYPLTSEVFPSMYREFLR